MSHFHYTAQCNGGAAISGKLESEDSVQALNQLQQMGLSNIDLRMGDATPSRRSLGSNDFIFFNEQLASLANSGICLDEGLRQLGKDVHSGPLRSVLEAVADDIERGQSLHDALERHASRMPPLYSRVVRAGAQSGHLPATLLNLSSHLRLVAETRRLLAEALTYPAIIFVLAMGLFCGVLMFVVPQFIETFEDFDVRLPPLTMMMITLSRALPGLLIGVAVITLVLLLVLQALRRSSAGRLWREHFVLRIPFVGSLIRSSLQARFLRSMAFAIDSALPLPEAMRLAGGSTGSPTLVRDAEHVAIQLERGVPLEEVCQRTTLIPAMFGYIAGMKGDAATLCEGLVQLSKACESRADHSQSMLRGWMAPMAVFAVGTAIGLLILALFMPLVQLVQSVSGA